LLVAGSRQWTFDAMIRMREKSKFVSRFNADSTVQSVAQKIFLFRFSELCDCLSPSRLDAQGAYRDHHDT
jgi:hypothetical protein